jgi:hypothetical protein
MATDTACWTLSGRRSRDPGSTETNVQGSPQNLEDLPVERPRENPVLSLLVLAVQFGIAQSHSSMRTASPSGIQPTAELDLVESLSRRSKGMRQSGSIRSSSFNTRPISTMNKRSSSSILGRPQPEQLLGTFELIASGKKWKKRPGEGR